MALRRRFAFIDLEPELGDRWKQWMHQNFGVDLQLLAEFQKRIGALNSEIRSDAGLGKQFSIGHSYFTPARGQHISDPQSWFTQVVETEIAPLLEEYWFDNPEKAEGEACKILDGL